MITLRCYDPSDDRDGGIHAWYSCQRPEFKAEIDVALELLVLEIAVAKAPQLKPLRGRCAGLSEVMIDFEVGEDHIHIRILGIEAGQHEFVLLFGFRKFGNADYGPACRSANTRKRGVLKDGRRAGPCRFP